MATAHVDDPAAAVSSCQYQTEDLLPRMFRNELRQLLSSSEKCDFNLLAIKLKFLYHLIPFLVVLSSWSSLWVLFNCFYIL